MNFKKIIILTSCLLLLCGCSKKETSDNLVDNIDTIEETQEKPETNEYSSSVKIELVDYNTYKFDDLNFAFVIAQIRVTTEEPASISLEHFVTSEGIRLNEVDDYVNELELHSYFLGKQSVFFDLTSTKTQYFANIFIPVKDVNAKSISLSNDFDSEEMIFEMDHKQGTKEMLSYASDDVITDGKTYQMSVSSAYEITGEEMTNNGTEYTLPSTVSVYCFNVEAMSLWGDEIVIESATYTTSESGETFTALGSSIRSEKHENILGKSFKESETGSLFFVAYNPISNPITYKGVLKLIVKGSENPIEVNVNLN